MTLEGKHIIVTGAASGIGRATAIMAASRGAAVMAVDYNDRVEETADTIRAAGGTVIAQTADISREDDVKAFTERCVAEFGILDGLYANAGIGGAGKPFLELGPDDFARTLGINTVGTFLCIKHAVPCLVSRRHGSIVCTASVAGLRANAGGVDYSASKAAVISMVQTIAYQLYGTGVRINAICPGLIETGMTAGVFTRARARGAEDRIGQINPAARYGNPEEIAEMACFLLSDGASYVNGQAIAVDGGLSASHPWVFPRKQ
ncbi:MAG: SDR family oxidoreductase [Pseudomonadales bacterium]|nr:SDR family oxidoreductase [Pseudomonadales bacterium]